MSFLQKIFKRQNTYLLATGGTGGHVFPAISLSLHLEKKGIPNHISTDLRGKKYIEGTYPSIDFSVILKKNLGNKSTLKRFISILPSCFTAFKLILKIKPKAVISFGGYPSFPVCCAAKLTNTPIFLHEQNSVAGLVTRLFLSSSKAIMLSFPQTKYINEKYRNKTYFTGNFIRQPFLNINSSYSAPKKNEEFNILVLGGSQGAASIAEKTIAAIKALPCCMKKNISLTLQAPEKKIPLLKEQWPLYKDMPISGQINSFFYNMPEQLKSAHLIIARSGASTVWEILATKRPAIFFPFSAAADNHQYYNALYLKKCSGAWILKDQEQQPGLETLLESLLKDPSTLNIKHKALEKFYNQSFEKNPLEFAEKILQSTV